MGVRGVRSRLMGLEPLEDLECRDMRGYTGAKP